ncbi:hypothetical protein E8E13_010178 [Curvularia kusanoi]|uniref:Uncharacterized protein n=1 Tax=Curvularia kusanoi TaxID=90978 RepID=A0A9P4TJU8_CURKU|nr:hypothetical protein E8E13_010178 [Curvularia kusanoi]
MAISDIFRKLHEKHKVRKESKSSQASESSPRTTSQSLQQPSTLHQLLRSLDIDPQPASLFLSLPGEIRNKIYAYALDPVPPNIYIRAQPECVLALSILGTCRQIRSEALSLLCADRSFHLRGLFTANQFFTLVHDYMPNLRRVTICLAAGWQSESSQMAAERRTLLDHLELAEGLCELVVEIRMCLPREREWAHLEDPESVGAMFLLDVRSVVDRKNEPLNSGKVMRERFQMLCDQVGETDAGLVLKKELEEEDEAREEKVFKLRRWNSTDGLTEKVTLPVQIPDYAK